MLLYNRAHNLKGMLLRINYHVSGERKWTTEIDDDDDDDDDYAGEEEKNVCIISINSGSCASEIYWGRERERQ